MTEAAITRLPTGLHIRKQLAAAPSAVFAAFADAATLARWWAPPECPIVESALDFRAGGVWHYRLRSAATGAEAWTRAVFDEIVQDRLIAFTETSSDALGSITPEREPAATTVEFLDSEGGTLLDIRVQHASAAETERALLRGVEGGFARALAQLDTILTSEGAPHD